ncbi:TonB-dependent receptor [Sphingobium sp.]|uniref:TonB-dependent receptor n=1 Tax=Sphingobium sp. TaxID=1912891 RepID=UPI0028BF049F|nr:TonB-dependent receptor [Sphingobium sp.]
MKRALAVFRASSAAWVFVTPAFAQSAPPAPVVQQAPDTADLDERQIGDIIVTAQKRSERINDVPLSITAATGETLAKAGVVAPEDLVKVVPGFSYARTLFGAPSFIIRGVGVTDSSLSLTPAVSAYVDQVPLPYLVEASGAAFDLERVEVLKGPQGTLFGQNSTGGAVNFVAAKPTNDFQAGGSFTYGRFNQADIEAFISGPISSTLNGRLAMRHESRDGWQVSQTRPGERLGVRDFTQARALLDWKPSDRLNFELNLNGWRDRSETQAFQFQSLSPQLPAAAGGATEYVNAISPIYTQPAPRNPRLADWGVELAPGLPAFYQQGAPGSDLHKKNSFVQISLKGEAQLSDAVTLTSISAYSHYKQSAPFDLDATRFWQGNFRISGDIENVFQELRLAGDIKQLKWMVGGNYSHDSVDENQLYQLAGSNSSIAGFRFANAQSDFLHRVKTVSAFGDVQYEILPDLTAQGSVRYTNYKDNFRGCLRDAVGSQWSAALQNFANNILGASPPVSFAPGGCLSLHLESAPGVAPPSFSAPQPVVRSLQEDNISWRAGLSWKISANNMLYANVTRGYKSGGFPGVVALVDSQFDPIGQESVLAYEAGFKLSLAERVINLNGAGFYYDYIGKQLISYVPNPALGPSLALVAIPKSRIQGFELETTIRPTQELTISAAATYIDSRVVSSFNAFTPLGAPKNIRGEQLPNTPKWQLQGGVDYVAPMSSAIDLHLGGSARYQSSTNATFGEESSFLIRGYTIVDAFAGIESSNGKWTAQVWGRNLFNKYYLTSILQGGDTIGRTTGMGATYGITVNFKY